MRTASVPERWRMDQWLRGPTTSCNRCLRPQYHRASAAKAPSTTASGRRVLALDRRVLAELTSHDALGWHPKAPSEVPGTKRGDSVPRCQVRVAPAPA